MNVTVDTSSGKPFAKIDDSLKKFLSGIEKKASEFGEIHVGLQKDALDYNDTGADIPAGFTTMVVYVGVQNEFGEGRIPARKWLRRSVLADDKYYKQKIIDIHKDLPSDDKLYPIAMGELGRIAVQNVQRHVESNDIGMVDNAESTQKAKGGNTPMIDTKHLISQVDWRFTKDI